MTSISRRSLMTGAAVATGSTALGRSVVKAAPSYQRISTGRKAQGEKIQLDFSNIFGSVPGVAPGATKPPMDELIEAFNEQSQTVEVLNNVPGATYDDLLLKLQADLAAGGGPDMATIPWTSMSTAVNGFGLQSLDDKLGDRMTNITPLISEFAWPLVTFTDGKIKGLPLGLSSPMLYYNADVFETAGVNPDEAFRTWESLAATFPALKEAIGDGSVITMGSGKDWPAQTIVQSNGGRILSEDGTTFVFDSAEGKEALETIARFDADGFMDHSANTEINPNFFAGFTAIMPGSTGVTGIRAQSGFNVGTSTWPTFGDKPRRSSTGGCFLAIFSQDEAKYDAIAEFLEFFAGPVGYPIWHKVGYINISTQELDIIPGQEPAYQQFREGLERETNWPGSRGVEIQQVWRGFLDRMWTDGLPVEEGVAQAKEEMTSLIS